MGMEDFWEQLPTGKEDKPLLFEMGPLEYDFHDIDGMITDEPGVVLATFYADCVPLYFVDPVHRAIGLSHSGWRGTVVDYPAVCL